MRSYSRARLAGRSQSRTTPPSLLAGAPGVAQRDRTVENRGLPAVRNEVAVPLELKRLSGLPGGLERLLELRGDGLHRSRIQILHAAWSRDLEKAVVKAHVGLMGVLRAHPVDIAFHLVFVGARRARS